jgi:hypothetical protein
VNAIIGLGVVIIALLALATICMRKGLKGIRQTKESSANQD